MAEASRRASGRPSRGGTVNARFLATGVEALPTELDGLADRVTVRFPWGSLLRGTLALDAEVAASIARLVAPGGRLEITLSLTGRDRLAGHESGVFGDADVARMGTVYGSLGLDLVDARRSSAAELAAMHSTWARRLRAGRDRDAWRMTFARRPTRSVG